MSEQRKWPRNACREQCRLLSCAGSMTSLASQVMNYSLKGFGIETDIPLHRGEQVKLRVLNSAADRVLVGVGQRVGRVRWCSSRPEELSGRYAAGIEMIGGVSEQVQP